MFSQPFPIICGSVKGAFVTHVTKGLNGGLVVGPAALRIERSESVPLEVGNWDDGSINWQLLVVDTKTVAMSVRVGE
jgi:hypothetical protein